MNIHSILSGSDQLLESPEGTREEIMNATYLSLCEYGYAGITIDRIGKHFPKSKSLIYHHYDGKDELLQDFLEFITEIFEKTVPFDEAEGADEHLEAILDHVFMNPLPERREEFTRAMIELRSQAAHNNDYRRHYTRHDDYFIDGIEAIIESGIESDVFRDTDSTQVAEFLFTLINGSMTRRVTSNNVDINSIREEIDRYLRARLVRNEE